MSDEATSDNPLVLALHAQIQLVASRPIDMRMLTELEKTCLLARELIVIGKQPEAMQKHALIAGGGWQQGVAVGSDYVSAAMPMYAGPPAFSSPQETFGVTAIREIVSALGQFMPKPHKPPVLPEPRINLEQLMAAINIAKASGETVLEDHLRETLIAELDRDVAARSPEPATENQEAAE